MKDHFDRKTLSYTRREIQDLADGFRTTHWPDNRIPIDIELIIEQMGMDIEPVSRFKQDIDIVAALCPDLKTISVDLETLLDDRQLFFLRFSLAHELGHLILHKPFFEWYSSRTSSATVREWVVFLQEQDRGIFSSRLEKDADEFAGRLLVPPDHLRREASQEISRLGISDTSIVSTDEGRDCLARAIHRRFEVNVQVVAIRLRIEDILNTC